ncbi:MAG: hypothetical protein COV29_00550 [Candidatus Yanofskybacteria bacterium CG10_big_fil_rev_8_21_14_0_10_36_16]|uniref:Uncharacterized protein n=1 Tax=Candidatus Yanofskybacteria bacterium CG10_big_fil_rev_8_21_14_0_10_36_16 TaxID=1975096 RepID=A0A2J0Q8D2_9BACT|nr:MAG: hypothetical protein COV29_00550 [Candidatus Yanofskybacteria bacterium CG10_big_fil_rev_8_21_14_0_10_36_16]
MKKMYFAHPVNTYNKPVEKAFVKLIVGTLFGSNSDFIENPNQPHHQVGYDKWARRKVESSTNHKGMNYYYEEVLPHCTNCVAVPFLDGRLGLGVASEAKWFLERNQYVWLVIPIQNVTAKDLATFVRDPFNGLFEVRPTTDEEKNQILGSDPKIVVPHEETRLRTWKIYNRVERPYEEAHLVRMPIPDGFYPTT